MTIKPTCSVIISAGYIDSERRQSVENLIFALNKQTLVPDEIIVIRGAKPRTKAHNQGVGVAKGEVIIFFDDDICLNHISTIEVMVDKLVSHSKMGIVGLSILPLPSSSYFQRVCSQQLLKARNMISHAALSIRKSLYNQIGGELEQLYLNDDAYLNYKVLEAGFQISHLSDVYSVYHPDPKNFTELVRKYFYQGMMQAHDYKTQPDLILYAPRLQREVVRRSSLLRQIKRNIKILFVAIIHLQPLLITTRIMTGFGFCYGYLKSSRLVVQSGLVEKYSLNNHKV